jgi:hypothetical protein
MAGEKPTRGPSRRLVWLATDIVNDWERGKELPDLELEVVALILSSRPRISATTIAESPVPEPDSQPMSPEEQRRRFANGLQIMTDRGDVLPPKLEEFRDHYKTQPSN